MIKRISYRAGGNGCTTSGQMSQWRNTLRDPAGGGGVTQEVTYSYTYDGRGNITAITDGTHTRTYQYDSRDQLIRENDQAAGRTWTYTYDSGGNITARKEYAYTTGALGTVKRIVAYTYGDSTWKDLLTGYDGRTLSYDAGGNLTGDGTWTYSWQRGRQLAGMSGGGQDVSFVYTAEGQRIGKTADGVETKYLYVGDRLTIVKRGSEVLHFDYDMLGPCAVRYVDAAGNTGTFYYVRNGQGDVESIVNSRGAAVVRYAYDTWGKLLSITGPRAANLGLLNPFRYRSYVYDDETGLYYLGSRYYNPAWGRFINADVYVSTGQGMTGHNMFAYCLNNPVNLRDENGELANWIIGGLVGALVGGISSAIQGGNFLAGAAQGAVSGAIAGAAVDVALAVVATCGVAGVVAAGAISFFGGFAGNIAGEETYALATEGQLTNIDRDMLIRSAKSGALNVASMGVSTHLRYADKGAKGFNTSPEPAAIIREAKKNLYDHGVRTIDAASSAAALQWTTLGSMIILMN